MKAAKFGADEWAVAVGAVFSAAGEVCQSLAEARGGLGDASGMVRACAGFDRAVGSLVGLERRHVAGGVRGRPDALVAAAAEVIDAVRREVARALWDGPVSARAGVSR